MKESSKLLSVAFMASCEEKIKQFKHKSYSYDHLHVICIYVCTLYVAATQVK